MLDRTAATDTPILDVLTERWSTRIFDASTPIDEDALSAALEAARWAPSASNTQPWRFLVARRGSASHAKIVDALIGFNQAWAADAAALVVFVATSEIDGKTMRWAAYDVGQAAAHFTVQAHAAGLATHQMGGFDADRLSGAFSLAAELRPLTVMAVGALGDFASAPEQMRERESAPRTRRPVEDSVLLDD